MIAHALTSIDRARLYLAKVPGAVSGSGGHDATFVLTMNLLHGFKLSDQDTLALLTGWNINCRPPWSPCELLHKVRQVAATAPSRPAGWLLDDGKAFMPSAPPTPPKWPQVNLEQVEAIAADGPKLADLWESSPIRFDDGDPQTEAVIDQLFPGNPLLCCAATKTTAETRHHEDWRGKLAGLQFIVPSPMSATHGATLEGKQSTRCLNNTGPRRFVIVEFDGLDADIQAAVLWHLATMAPLVMVVHSGGKSLHGWFYCASQPEQKIMEFLRYAVALGADHRLANRCQLCRMPDGIRENGARQHVQYFNPALITI